MDPFRAPPADTLAAARLHVQALTDCGLPREALLRALLENYGDGTSNAAAPGGLEVGGFAQQSQVPQPQQQQQQQQDQEQQQVISQQQPVRQQPQVLLQQQQQQVVAQQQQQPHLHQPQPPPQPPQQQILQGKLMQGRYGYNSHHTRLSVSTTSSQSSGRASIMSAATTMSSVSSQSGMPGGPGAAQEIAAPKMPTPPAPPVKSNNRGTSKPQGAYWCTFCDVAFQRKFDWKRHEDEFHERYKRYPCPNCNRIFWGANTFNQHHKNAHGCTTCPHAERVVRYTQRKTAWACGFCGGFLASRDRYFDHVARHYEDGCNKSHWNHSLVIYGLLHQPSVTHAWKDLLAAMYGHLPREQQPMLEWDVKVTGNAPGFLEGESPGKLQDLLEFFNENNDDPRFIVRLAHDSANIRLRHEIQSPVASSPASSIVSRPISEPPKTKPVTKGIPSTKHMSTPQSTGPPPPAYDGTHQHVLKKQRSLAPAPDSPFSKPFLFSPPSQLPSQQPTPQPAPLESQPLPPHKLINNPFHQPMMGIQETGAGSGFYDLTVTHIHPHMQAHDMTSMQLDQPQPQQMQQQLQQQQQQSQFLAPMNLNLNLFEDWSSLAGTIVDENTWWQQAPSHQGPTG